MIKLNNVIVNKNDAKILCGINLHIKRGECVVLTGSSGAGKTSILRVILGALPITSGTIDVCELQLNSRNIPEIRNRIAYIGQEPIMGAEFVRDALLLPFSFNRHRDALPSNDKVVKFLNSVNLDESILEKKSTDISGGERQRVSIVRALLLNRSTIFADEITSSLDPNSKQKVIDLLLNGKHTILSVSHDEYWIKRCNRTLHITNGIIEGN